MATPLRPSDLGARPALHPALALALGAGLSELTGRSPGIFLASAAALLLGAALLPTRPGAHLFVLLAACLAGVGLGVREARVRVPDGVPGPGRQRLIGTVEAVRAHGDDTSILLRVERAPGPADFGAELWARGRVAVWPGQRVSVLASLKPPSPLANPGQMDFFAAKRRRGVIFSGGFDAAELVALTPPSRWRLSLGSVHARLAEAVERVSPTPDAAALFLTVAAGQRARLSPEWEERFSRSGLAHVLSVSGLHVAAVALLALWLVRKVLSFRGTSRFSDVRRRAAPLALPLVWAYVVFTGAQGPAVRSAVMASVMLLAMALWRRAEGLNALGLAAMALLLFDPAAVADLSLQLSFLSVLSLLLLAPRVRALFPAVPRPAATDGPLRRRLLEGTEACLSAVAASLSITVATLPLLAAAFGRVSLIGVVANVVCLPLCGLLTACAAFGAAAFAISPALAEPLLYAGTHLSNVLLWAAERFADVPGGSLPVAPLPWALAAAFTVGLFAFSLGTRARVLSALVPLCLAVHLSPPLAALGLHGQGKVTVTFLSVGQGDAVVVSSGGRHALIDGGGVPDGPDTGRRYVLPFLRTLGVRALELAVLTHPHPDHALGLISTLEELPARRLWLAEGTEEGDLTLLTRAAAKAAEVRTVRVGAPSLSLGAATLEVLGPPADGALLEGVNDRSVVLRVRHGEVTFLLTGDVEAAGEEALSPGAVTVMKAPHHGSRTSSSEAFVAAAKPRFVVFCVGRKNRFGFPHEEVVERYEAAGARCLRTDLDGAVTFESDGRDVEVSTFLPRGPGEEESAGVRRVANARRRPHRLAR